MLRDILWLRTAIATSGMVFDGRLPRDSFAISVHSLPLSNTAHLGGVVCSSPHCVRSYHATGDSTLYTSDSTLHKTLCLH